MHTERQPGTKYMERGVLFGGVLISVSLLAAVLFNQSAVEEAGPHAVPLPGVAAPAAQQPVPHPVLAPAKRPGCKEATDRPGCADASCAETPADEDVGSRGDEPPSCD